MISIEFSLFLSHADIYRNAMLKYRLTILFLLSFSSCDTKNYYPEIDKSIAEKQYEKYKLKLDTAYLDNNYFQVGVQLANLNAPSDRVFEYLDKGILQDKMNCHELFDWYEIYDDFKTNLVKADTAAFKNSFRLCLIELGASSYQEYIEDKHLKFQAKMARRTILDSTEFDMELIDELKQIYHDDQRIRKATNMDELSGQDSINVWQEIIHLDSINLLKIDSIIENYGYPKKEIVGYDQVSVPWLVLHHQGNIEIRDKHQALIEENFTGGLLNTYLRRSELIRARKGK